MQVSIPGPKAGATPLHITNPVMQGIPGKHNTIDSSSATVPISPMGEQPQTEK